METTKSSALRSKADRLAAEAAQAAQAARILERQAETIPPILAAVAAQAQKRRDAIAKANASAHGWPWPSEALALIRRARRHGATWAALAEAMGTTVPSVIQADRRARRVPETAAAVARIENRLRVDAWIERHQPSLAALDTVGAVAFVDANIDSADNDVRMAVAALGYRWDPPADLPSWIDE